MSNLRPPTNTVTVGVPLPPEPLFKDLQVGDVFRFLNGGRFAGSHPHMKIYAGDYAGNNAKWRFVSLVDGATYSGRGSDGYYTDRVERLPDVRITRTP